MTPLRLTPEVLLAQGPLVFVTEEAAANLHEYRELTTDDEAVALEGTFLP